MKFRSKHLVRIHESVSAGKIFGANDFVLGFKLSVHCTRVTANYPILFKIAS